MSQVKNGILQKPMNQTFSQKSNNQFNNNLMSTNAHTTSTKTLKFDPQTTIQQYTNNFFQENNTDIYQQTAKTIPRIINTPLTAPTSQQQQRNSQQKKQYKLQQQQEGSNNQKTRKCSILSGNSNLDQQQQNMSVYNRSPGKKSIQNQNQFYQTSPQKLQQNFQQKSENQMQGNSTQKINKNSQIKIQVQDQQQYSEINGFNEKEQFNQKNEIMDDFQQSQYIKSQQKFYQTMGIRKQQKENKKKTDQSEKLKEFEIDKRDTHQQMIKKSEKQIVHLKREFQKLRKKNADPTYGENFQSQNNKKQQIRTKALIQPEIFTQEELQQLADEEQQIETEAINKKLAKEEEQQKLKGYSPQSAVNINFKQKKYNSIKLKEKQFDEIEKGEQILLSKCKSQFEKIDKMQKTWNNFGIMGANSNKLRSESMKYIKQLKLINQINKQFKPSEKLILKEQSHGKKPENGETLNQFMDKMFKNPNISNKQFKVVKNLELHQNRIKTMDKNCVITASHSKNLGKFERNGDLY
ncbi:hypothetical protein PPERSA_02984 [Pseudocohnilembus persalinus]|uniref:Uncharacterized protein n=1 Tax=Pseudocohnilembus persalinus TaxID=266149 RepID=A0A0V0QEV0_PSEPJ|nr:hypothetical protein PPERSA_02984 [Pseudocohnilembus persalinus]|eukprot:KRX00724.1 hypothetical protein PPERSA_02984 [Pseudocohnilembus persalinus]